MPTLQEIKKRQQYITKANQIEEKYGLPKNLLVGVMGAESNFNPNAVSPVGAKGLMQLMKATAQEYGINPLNPSESIDAAGKYLASSYKKFGNWEDSLRSYNMGVGGLQKVKAGKMKMPKETQDYVGRVYKNAGIKYEEPSYANSVAPYMNQPTPTINNFDIPKQTTTFASVPDSAQEKDKTEETDKDIAEVEQKTKEFNFLDELNTTAAAFKLREKQQIEAPQTDYMQQYEQISQFIENPQVAQQGKKFKLQDERNLVQKDNISTNRPNTIYNQKELENISTYATKNNISIKDASERLYNANQHAQNNQVRTYVPQSTKSKVWEVATHPITAAGYAVRNEDLPENFSRGTINPHEMAVDIVNPFFYADQAGQAVKNTSEGDFVEAGMNTLNLLPLAAEYQTLSRGLSKAAKALGTEEGLLSKLKGNKNYTLAEPPLELNLDINQPSFSLERVAPKTKRVLPDYGKVDIGNDLTLYNNPSRALDETSILGKKMAIKSVRDNSSSKSIELKTFIDDSGELKYYMSADMPNRIKAGRAFLELDKHIPIGAKIQEPGSLSFDSLLNVAKQSKSAKFEPSIEGTVHLNDNAVFNKIKNSGDSALGKEYYTTAEKAEKGVEEVNTLLQKYNLPKAEVKQVVKQDGSLSKVFSINVPNIALKKLYSVLGLPIAGASYLATQGQEQNPPQYQQGGNFTENELAFLSEIAIKDNNGYWNPKNQGKVVEIDGGNITMKGVDQDIIGISKQTGEKKIMKPNKNYTFSNTKSVIEIPFFKK